MKSSTTCQTFGRQARLKRLSSSPLLQAYERLQGMTPTQEVEQQKAELLSQITAVLRASTDDASPLGLIPKVASPLEYILADFQSHSSIPLGLAFWTTFALTAQHICQRNGFVQMPDGAKVLPTLYTLVLADSGECKTWTLNTLGAAFPTQLNKLTPPKTAESLLQEMQENQKGKLGAMLLEIDEVGRKYRRWMDDPAMSLIGDVLLEAYTQQTIDLGLKSGGYFIESPVLSVLGYSQIQLFSKHFRSDDWLSGLMQRLIVAVCPPRQGWQEKLELHPLKLQLEKKALPLLRDVVSNTPIHGYTIDDSALAYARHHVSETVKKLGVTKGFALRSLFNAYKFATIFHVLHGKSSSVIDRDDLEHAVALVRVVLNDLRFLIDETERNEITTLIDKAIAAREKLDRGELKGSWSKKWLAQRVRGINSLNCNLVFEIVNAEMKLKNLERAEGNVVQFPEPPTSEPTFVEPTPEEEMQWTQAVVE